MEKKVNTPSTLLDTYFTYHNLTLLSGSEHDCAPLMPYMLMDAMNLIYDDYIKPLDLKHNLKHLRKQWHDAYLRLTSDFFRCFNADQQGEVVEIMDGLSAHIHNEVELFRVAVMNHFMHIESDTRVTLSAIIACNHLAQSAQILWKWVRRSRRGNMLANPHIAIVENTSLRFFDEYARQYKVDAKTEMDLTHIQTISDASHKLCEAIADFSRTWSESNMNERAKTI